MHDALDPPLLTQQTCCIRRLENPLQRLGQAWRGVEIDVRIPGRSPWRPTVPVTRRDAGDSMLAVHGEHKTSDAALHDMGLYARVGNAGRSNTDRAQRIRRRPD